MRTSTPRYDLLHVRVTRLTSALKKAVSGDAAAVAALRLSIRRVREVLPVLQLDAREVRKVDARLRKTARRLKPIVRADALLAQADEMVNTAGEDRTSRAADVRLRNALRQARLKLGVPVTLRRATADLKKAVVRLTAMSDALKGARESAVAASARRWAVKARVSRRATALKRALVDAGSVYLPGRLDALGRAARRLRFGAELLADSGAAINQADVRTLEQASEALDRLRESEALIRRLRRLQGELTPADLRAWQELDDLIVPLEHRCRRLHARYVREREALTLIGERLGERAASSTPSRRKVS